LSIEHAIRKYVQKHFDPTENRRRLAWMASSISPEAVQLPSEAELRHYESDDKLDHSEPTTKQFVEDHTFVRQPD
jgi:hypothetical protein